MPCSRAQSAKRAFASLLVSLGRKYGGLAGVAVDRDSSEAVILNAFRRLVRKVGGAGDKLNEQCLQYMIASQRFLLVWVWFDWVRLRLLMGLGWRGEVHPDKGGDQADSQRLHAARDAWRDAVKEAGPQKQGPQSSGSKRARATASDTSLGRGLGTRRDSGSQEGRRIL